MQMQADMLALSYGIYQLSCTVLGMRGHEPQPIVALYLIYLAQQTGKGGSRAESLAVAVHVLP